MAAAKLAAKTAQKHQAPTRRPMCSRAALSTRIAHIEDLITHRDGQEETHHHHADGSVHQGGIVAENLTRWYAIKLFERDEKAVAELNLPSGHQEWRSKRSSSDCEKEMDDDAESIITNQRYAYITQAGGRPASRRARQKGALTVSDKIDRIVTNRWSGAADLRRR